jgi:hypothetical protein
MELIELYVPPLIGPAEQLAAPSGSLLRPKVCDLADRLRVEHPQLLAETPERVGLFFPGLNPCLDELCA